MFFVPVKVLMSTEVLHDLPHPDWV